MHTKSATFTGRFSAAVGTDPEASSWNAEYVDTEPVVVAFLVAADDVPSNLNAPENDENIQPLSVVKLPVILRIASVCDEPNTRPLSTPFPSSNPRRNCPRKSGRLKVVEPSPEPKVVPIAAKSAAYMVRLTAEPFAFSHPVGAVVIAKHDTSPVN